MREQKEKCSAHSNVNAVSHRIRPGELPIKDELDELARLATPDLPDSEPEAWEPAPVSVDVDIGAELRVVISNRSSGVRWIRNPYPRCLLSR